MRYAAVASVLLLTITALDASAQTSAFATAPVLALVSPRPIAMTSLGTADFGIVTGQDVLNSSGTAFINPRAPGVGQSTAMFTISGEPNTAVSVTCSGVQTLFHTDGSHTMLFEAAVVHSQIPGNQSGATDGCVPGPGFSATLNSSGELYSWLGGWLNESINAVLPIAGTFNGTYTLTVAY